jgi:hypothetical protein
MSDERKSGTSRLVFDKEAQAIKTVRSDTSADAYERLLRLRDQDEGKLRDEISRLTSALQSERERTNEVVQKMHELREKNAEAMRALEPFAKAADSLDGKFGVETVQWNNEDFVPSGMMTMPTVGDLRRARSLSPVSNRETGSRSDSETRK